MGQVETKCLGLASNKLVGLHHFISDFEQKQGQRGLRGQHRFRLFATLDDPQDNGMVTFYPDAAIILSGKGDYAGRKRLYFVEID